MFWVYFLIGVIALYATVLLIGIGRVFDPRRLIGWYLVVFALTYLVRPILPETQDSSDVYVQLSITGFSAVPIQMIVAVTAALLCLAAGYRLADTHGRKIEDFQPSAGDSKPLIWLSLLMIAWAYVSAALFPGEGANENLTDRQYGVNTGTTAWLTESVQFASTGTTALYMLTGNLSMSLLLAVPWFVLKVSNGWSRVVLVAYFASLLCVLFVTWRRQSSLKSGGQASVLMIGTLFAILVFLPAAGTIRLEGGNFFDYSSTELVDVFLGNFNGNQLDQTLRDISGFESTVYMIETDQPSTWGMYYVYFYFIKPIPRTLWTNKPLPPDLAEWVVGVQEDTRYFGLAAGSIGDALFAWGWLGIPFEFFLTGWAFRRLEARAVDRQPSPAALLAYAGFFSLLPQLGRDSFIHMISERWLFVYGFPCLAFWYFSRARSTARQTRPAPRAVRVLREQ